MLFRAISGASAQRSAHRWAVESIVVWLLKRLVKVLGHPESRTAGRAPAGLGWGAAWRAELGYRPPVLGDLEYSPFRHDLGHDCTELGLGFKNPYPPHEKQTSLTSLNGEAQNKKGPNLI